MEAYEVRVYGWPTADEVRGPLLHSQVIQANDYWEAQDRSLNIWRIIPAGISVKLEKVNGK